MIIREYRADDWAAIQRVHDAARKRELALANLDEAFLPLAVAAEREDLFGYPGVFVAVEGDSVVGFTACTEDELAWLYVDPAFSRRGIGRALSEFALEKFPQIHSIEVLVGNHPARSLYESLGFRLAGTESGEMPGNERFTVNVDLMERPS